MSSDYERLRLKNIEDNKRILADLGLLNPFKPLPRVIKNRGVSFNANKSLKRKQDSTNERVANKKYIINDGSAKSVEDLDWHPSCEQFNGPRRRSQRLQGREALDVGEITEEVEKLCEDEPQRTVVNEKNRPMIYGDIPGVEIGSSWLMRIEVNHAGIHRPTVAGIHSGPEGAYSIALSGGYEDDIDMGDCFTYTGEGGRDLKGTKANPKNLRTAAQSKDQSLSRGNQALVRSMETGLPVRVLRGYKLDSPFAPDEGYRYDGLYKVEKWWFTTGLSGFSVYKFALRRLEDQPPPPWHFKEEVGDDKNSERTEEGESLEMRNDSANKENIDGAVNSLESESDTANMVNIESRVGRQESACDLANKENIDSGVASQANANALADKENIDSHVSIQLSGEVSANDSSSSHQISELKETQTGVMTLATDSYADGVGQKNVKMESQDVVATLKSSCEPNNVKSQETSGSEVLKMSDKETSEASCDEDIQQDQVTVNSSDSVKCRTENNEQMSETTQDNVKIEQVKFDENMNREGSTNE